MTDDPSLDALPLFAQLQCELAVEIEALGASLCSHDTIVAECAKDLQAIDYIAQKQRILARLMETGLAPPHVDGIEVDSFRSRVSHILAERAAA